MKQKEKMKIKILKSAMRVEARMRKERLEKFVNEVVARAKPRIEKMKRLKKSGANMYRVLLARLTDDKTGKLSEDPVIYAIRAAIKEQKETRSFFLGYAKDIRNHPKRHPTQAQKNPREYARADIMLALRLHFAEPQTHKLWTKAVRGEKAKFSYVKPSNW